MIIKKNGKIISKTEIYCKSWQSQARGLMFKKRKNLVMVFPEERQISLHNFFVFYPLEIAVLDKDRKVKEIKRTFWPFTFWTSEKKGRYLLELGEKYSKGKLVLGEKVKIDN